ncbi:MAG: aminotransferase class V-fold PLP-dependent enzyme [Planctomycetes bacterium]|jgi:aspartate aminotransferase-like enzyme|nr:aminotransferase class V-fold PLP-dependent enzyme [Planctomycetota bacterium]
MGVPVLFIPGPTEVEADLRAILARPLIGHREASFVAVVQDVCQRLARLLMTGQPAAFETCAATALMEAGIRNLVRRQGLSLHLVGGAFGERWQKIADSCGRSTEALVVPLGHAHDPAVLARRLQHGPVPDAVCITHNETATGVIEPLHELAAVVHRHAPDALVLVDVVTSVAGAELRFDAWGLDFVFAGTQKCLALPPGLCLYALSERARQRATSIPERGFLLDLPRALHETNDGKTIATPCIPLVFALQEQLRRVEAEGLEARWARHRQLRDTTLAWAATRGFVPFVADAAARSPTVSCIDARSADVAAMWKRALAAGFQFDRGYGELRDRAFRIGHMGDHTATRLQALLAAM